VAGNPDAPNPQTGKHADDEFGRTLFVEQEPLARVSYLRGCGTNGLIEFGVRPTSVAVDQGKAIGVISDPDVEDLCNRCGSEWKRCWLRVLDESIGEDLQRDYFWFRMERPAM